MSPGRRRYARVLRSPGVLASLAPYLLGRLSVGMVSLAVLLLVRHNGHSFRVAGLASAAVALAVAVAAPVFGRLADRRGQPAVLVPLGLLHPVAASALVLAAHHSGSVLLVLLSAATGATVPPLAACMRALWPTLVPEDDLRGTGYTVEALVVEACEMAAPLTVAVLCALARPSAAVLVAGWVGGLGAVGFALSRPSRTWHGQGGQRRWTGPLAVPGVLVLLGVVLLSTASFGFLEVGVTAFARQHGHLAAAGLFLAGATAGSFLGGYVYGARSWSPTLSRQLVVLLLGGAAVAVLPALATGTTAFAAALFLAGLAIAPAIAVQLQLMVGVAPPGAVTEAFTWGASANFLGLAAGSAVAGSLVDAFGVSRTLLGAAATTALAGALAWSGAPLLRTDGRDVPVAGPLARHLVLLRHRHSAFQGLTEAVADARAREQAALARVAELEEQVAGLRGRLAAPAFEQVTRRIAAILARVDDDCLAMRHRAEQQAESIRQRARVQADRLLREAEQQAAEVLARAGVGEPPSLRPAPSDREDGEAVA